MSKINSVLYPFSHEAVCISRYFALTDYKITTAIIPEKLPVHCLNMSYFDDLNNNDITISYDFVSSINYCDTVIWAPYNYKDIGKYFKEVTEHISFAISSGKNIICLESLSRDILEEFVALSKLYQVSFTYLNFNNGNYNVTDLLELKKINTPVITVVGISENVDKFSTQLYVRDAFLQAGYKVSQIGSKPYSELFGIRPYPSFMFEPNISEKQKILNFNNYIHELEINENPEVIIIGIPGEIMRINNRFLFNFGITLFLSSCAYDSDFTVLCMGCNKINADFLSQCKKILYYKYSMPVDCCFISNIRLNEDSLKSNYADLEVDILPKLLFGNEKESVKQYADLAVFDINDSKDSFIEYIQKALRQEVL